MSKTFPRLSSISTKLEDTAHESSTRTRSSVLEGPRWSRWNREVIKSDAPFATRNFAHPFAPAAGETKFLGGLGHGGARKPSKLHPNRTTLVQKLLNMRTQSRVVFSLTEDAARAGFRQKRPLPPLEQVAVGRMRGIVKAVCEADNIPSPTRSDPSDEERLLVTRIERTTPRASIETGQQQEYVALDGGLEEWEKEIQRNFQKTSQEFNFRQWIDDIKANRDPQKITQKAKTPSPDPDARKLPIGIVRKAPHSRIPHLRGTFYGRFPHPPAPDVLTKTHDKFFIPHTMTKRAEGYFEKRKSQNRAQRRGRLLHMKTPLPPASDCSSDDSVENVRSLTLIKTPYFVIPTFRFQPRRKKDRLRNRFLSKSQLRRISMLLYDRSRIQQAKPVDETQTTDATTEEAFSDKHVKMLKRLKPATTTRRARYRKFIRECYIEKLKEFEELYGGPKEVICFEDFKTTTKETSKPSSVQQKEEDPKQMIEKLERRRSSKKTKISYQLYRPQKIFARKRHMRTTKCESSVGPLYLDPRFMEKFRKPRMFTRYHKFYTSVLRDRPDTRDRLNVTSRAFEEERFGFHEKYLHRLATEWDDNYVNDLRHRPPTRKFCVKSDILELRDATRKIFSMYYTTENLLNLLEQQKAEEAAIKEVEDFSTVCSDFLTNVKNDSYDRVIRKMQALKPLQQKTKELSVQVEELRAELEFVTESVLEEERRWDTLMKLQNYYYLLMEPEWRKINDWIHRSPTGELHEAVDIIENCSTINVRNKRSNENIREFFEREIYPNIDRMKGIAPDPDLLRRGLATLKQKVFTSLNQYNKTLWIYEIFLHQVEGLNVAFERCEKNQKKMMKFQSAQEHFLEERAYLLSYEVKQVMGKPLERSIKSPTASRIKIKAICNQLYDYIVPRDRRCPQIDDQMTPSEKFAKLHDFVMELLHQLDRIPVVILHRTEKEIRREQMCILREAQKAVVKQNRFQLLQKQIRGHFKDPSK